MAAKTAEAAAKGPAAVEELKKKYDTTDVIFTGVAAANGWKAGKKITEEEYTKAVAAFLRAPLGRR